MAGERIRRRKMLLSMPVFVSSGIELENFRASGLGQIITRQQPKVEILRPRKLGAMKTARITNTPGGV